jgi:hypothetical protein
MTDSLWSLSATPESTKKDIQDILEMRFNGDFYAACETRWSMIHVDQLMLNQEGEETVTMRRVTDRYWKEFVYRVNVYLEMFGVVVWRVRKEEVFCGDDEVRKRLYGENAKNRATVEIPYVIDWNDYDVVIDCDEEGRVDVAVKSKKSSKPVDVIVSRGRRGGPRKTNGVIKFDTDCGAVLEAWRRFKRMQKLSDDVAEKNSKVVPFLEHVPLTDQVRLQDGMRKAEQYRHPVDKYGYDVEPSTALVNVEPKQEIERQYIHVPPELRISSTQPRAQVVYDLEKELRILKELYASVLQLPIRYVLQETHNNLRTDSRAAVDEDMVRSVNAVVERRNEIVDVIKEAFFVIHKEASPNVHLPARKSIRVEDVYTMFDRGLLVDQVVKEEIAAMTGMKLDRFTKNALLKPE